MRTRLTSRITRALLAGAAAATAALALSVPPLPPPSSATFTVSPGGSIGLGGHHHTERHDHGQRAHLQVRHGDGHAEVRQRAVGHRYRFDHGTTFTTCKGPLGLTFTVTQSGTWT